MVDNAEENKPHIGLARDSLINSVEEFIHITKDHSKVLKAIGINNPEQGFSTISERADRLLTDTASQILDTTRPDAIGEPLARIEKAVFYSKLGSIFSKEFNEAGVTKEETAKFSKDVVDVMAREAVREGLKFQYAEDVEKFSPKRVNGGHADRIKNESQNESRGHQRS